MELRDVVRVVVDGVAWALGWIVDLARSRSLIKRGLLAALAILWEVFARLRHFEGSAELAIIRLRRTASTTIVYGADGCRVSQAVTAVAGIGRAMKYPWAALQPRRVMSSSPASVDAFGDGRHPQL